MKAYDLKPTYENLFETYKNNTIDRNADLFQFIDILNSIEDACSIAVDGNWGCGKTFFVKQVKMVMDAHNDFVVTEKEEDRSTIVSIRKRFLGTHAYDIHPQVCVYYDAWENDNDEDPVMSLVYTILQCIDADFSFRDRDWIKAGASLIDAFTGKNWTQVVENLRSTSPMDGLKAHKDVKLLVDEFLDSLLPERGNRLIMFVDELDRCKPSYAVRLLERVKHYFSHDNITFVFSVNTKELHHTIKKHYGNDFDGSRYLERFFDFPVSLPPPNLEKFYQCLNFNKSYYEYDIVCEAVVKTFHLELREIAKFFRLAKIAAYDVTHGKQKLSVWDGQALEFCIIHFVPIMLGLRICNTPRYMDFIQGRDCNPLLEVVENLDMFGYGKLLAGNETYDNNDVTKKLVTVEEKLKSVYDALFVHVYNENERRVNIGTFTFDRGTKDFLLWITGLLSKYTNPYLD